jgi:anti-sigma B factor antagonist
MATHETQTIDGGRQVKIFGELDMATADGIGRILTATIRALETLDSRSVTPRLEVDLAGVSFIDSSGIRALVRAKNCATHSGVDFTVKNAGGIVERVLVTLGLLDYLTQPNPS